MTSQYASGIHIYYHLKSPCIIDKILRPKIKFIEIIAEVENKIFTIIYHTYCVYEDPFYEVMFLLGK